MAGGSMATVFSMGALASAVRNAGHQVIVSSTEEMMPTIAGIGLPAVPFTDLSIGHFTTTDRAGNPVEFTPGGDAELRFTGAWFGRMAAAGLGPLRRLSESWRPDAVVGGTLSYVAPLLAAHLGVPFVRQSWDISETADIDAAAREELRPELDELGLSRIPAPDLLVDICPPSLRLPSAPPAQYMRWVPANPQCRLEPWMYEKGARRRVCVTSGTRVALAESAGFLRTLVKEVSPLDVEVVVAAPADAAEELRAEFPGLRAGWFPLDVVAPTCDVILHHAGGSTGMTAMQAGVPQLLIPQGVNFEAGSRRIAEFGAAITILPGDDTPDTVTAACQELLSNSSYAQRAGRLADEIAALPLPSDVVGAIEKTASGS
ncbi:glycosyltransferase [Streptomyces anulatus]|uniref:glycosyltransferase n=1 Tax=Streptomyces anulatus TaxID=1892 RepID=UPI003636EA53